MIQNSLTAVATATLLLSGTVSAQAARDYIFIVGSSTVYPFATVVAENFGRVSGAGMPLVVSEHGASGCGHLLTVGSMVEHQENLCRWVPPLGLGDEGRVAGEESGGDREKEKATHRRRW